MIVRNKLLYEKTLKMTKKVIDYLEKIPKEQYPTRDDCVYLFKEGGFETKEEAKTDYGLLLFNLRTEISQLVELKECAEYMVKNPIIMKTFTVSDKDGNPVKTLDPIHVYDFNLRFFLGRYFNQNGSVIFNQQTFDKVYLDFQNYFYKTTLEGSTYSPLENFSCENELKFTKDLRIRKILESEKVEFLELQRFSWMGDSPFGNIDDISNILEITYHKRRDKRKDKTRDASLYTQDFEDVITSLRLYKHGVVNFHVVSQKSDLWIPCSSKGYSSGKNDYKHPLGTKYTLTPSEFKRVQEIFRKYSKFQARNRKNPTEYLNIALRRFNSGVEETDIEDKVIDFMISFEAMFLQSNGELTFKLANRVAVLLGKTSDERETIREIMIVAYAWRSCIVHGNKKQLLKIQGKTVSEKEFVLKIEDTLRKALFGFISLTAKSKSRGIITKDLDNSLLNIGVMKDLQKNAGII